MSPHPIHPPSPKLVGVAQTKYLRDTAAFGSFYADEDNRDKHWVMGANNNALTEAPLPCLLAPPTFVVEFLGKQWGHASHTNYANLYQNTLMEGNHRSSQQNGN
jgi:hypothetical protein